jgi:hypothetical protein
MRTMIRERALRDFLSATLLAAVIVGCGSGGAAGQDARGTSDAEGHDGTTGGDANGGSDAPLGDDTSSVQDSAAGCPSSAPGAGNRCPSVSANCSYGGGICCGGAYSCATGGTWQVLEATCACNAPATDAGGPCGGHACQAGTSCCGPPECGFCIPYTSGVQCPSTCNTGSADSGAGFDFDGDIRVGDRHVHLLERPGASSGLGSPRSSASFARQLRGGQGEGQRAAGHMHQGRRHLHVLAGKAGTLRRVDRR